MTHTTTRAALLLSMSLALSGCGFGSSPPASDATSPPAASASTPAVPDATAAQPATAELSAEPAVTSAPATPAQASSALQSGQSFAIDQRATSDRSALKDVALVIYRAEVGADSLTLRVGFQNIADKSFGIAGVNGSDARLEDAAGTTYKPTDVSDNLRRIAPEGGFSPGGANVGTISFALPADSGPYTFELPEYAPIQFSLDTPFTAVAPLAVDTYAIDTSTRSQERALSNIELRVQSLEVNQASVVVEVAFVNASRQGFDLIRGPDGSAAQLLDAEGQQYDPTAVSDSLKDSIAPDGGWAPGQEHVGTITFPRPEADSTLRFVFPEYDAVSMRFADNKLAEASVTSASGGAPQPTATPSPGDLAYTGIEQLLATQSAAVLAGDADGYLATFDPALQDEQRALLARITQAPLVSYTVQLAPSESVTDGQGGNDELSRLRVEISYALRGIDPTNTFLHEARYSFAQAGGAWRVSKIDPGNNPPYWELGEVVVKETPHFLIFARPETESELPTLEQETEQAYSDLQQRGLPLEPRYVAYFAATANEFRELTGRPASRYLGVALSRYSFSGDDISTTSRAFYINGGVFADESQRIAPDERQTTITHELVHLALAQSTRPFTPPWLTEGAAVFYSDDLGADQRQRLRNSGQLGSITLPKLTGAGSLGAHDVTGQRIGAEYIFSGETVAYLEQTFGEQKLLEFYRSYADVPAADVRDRMPRAGGPIRSGPSIGGSAASNPVFTKLSQELTDQAVQQIFGITVEQLDADVKAWIAGS